MLSQQAISEYRQIYKRTFGEEISVQDAKEQGVKLLRLFKLIYKPVSKDWEQALKEKYANHKSR